jgi:hypothetical protein
LCDSISLVKVGKPRIYTASDATLGVTKKYIFTARRYHPQRSGDTRFEVLSKNTKKKVPSQSQE